MSSHLNGPSVLFTSESVTEGHPDKLCDQISDAILDSLLADDPYARVACETAVTTGLVLVMGEITTSTYVEIPQIVRETVRQAGYDRAEYGFDYEATGVITSIQAQSPDIASGVNQALEARDGQPDESQLEALGAGDQGMVFGYACRETEELMPLPIALAHRLCQRLAQVRKERLVPYLRPDGKSQVTIEYSHGRPVHVATVVMSAQHDPDVSHEQITDDLVRLVAEPVLPNELAHNTRYLVNPTGRFVVGGPRADSGLTGRKVMVDSYGGMASQGGGCFSGKDPTKVDRSGAYAARWVAKNLVAAELCERVQVQVAYAIGVARPVGLSIDTFGTERVSPERIRRLVEERFDLRPAAIIRDLNLRRPVFRPTAVYGHFGRPDLDLTWEDTAPAAELAAAVGARLQGRHVAAAPRTTREAAVASAGGAGSS